VLPAFLPSHIGPLSEIKPLRFGDVFDVPRLSNELGINIVEWHELKNASRGSESEKIGCWSAWATNPSDNEGPRHSQIEEVLKLGLCLLMHVFVSRIN
jgi:hypothetical protein